MMALMKTAYLVLCLQCSVKLLIFALVHMFGMGQKHGGGGEAFVYSLKINI